MSKTQTSPREGHFDDAVHPSSASGSASRWNEFCEAFVTYRKEHKGDAHVPQSYVTPSGLKLGRWLNHVRWRGNHSYSEEKLQQLSSIGFLWNRRFKWIEMYQYLSEYKEQHNHCRVPKTFTMYNDTIRLGRWVVNQRTEYSRKKKGLKHHITDQQIRMLETIGFVWSTQERYRVEPSTEQQKTTVRSQQTSSSQPSVASTDTVGNAACLEKKKKRKVSNHDDRKPPPPPIARKKKKKNAQEDSISTGSFIDDEAGGAKVLSLRGNDEVPIQHPSATTTSVSNVVYDGELFWV